jgi:hypothetical protein
MTDKVEKLATEEKPEKKRKNSNMDPMKIFLGDKEKLFKDAQKHSDELNSRIRHLVKHSILISKNSEELYDEFDSFKIVFKHNKKKKKKDEEKKKEDKEEKKKLKKEKKKEEEKDDSKEELVMTDYNGKTFANIRKISFITDEEYLKSIGGKDFELHLGMGKGSNFFMKTHDNKYIIKSISKEESDECRIFIEDFCQYFEKNLNTLILPIFGSHKIDFSFKELNLIVMENLFVNKPDESYDLKGSSGLSNYF